MEEICIISQRYPCEATPTTHVFVQKLAWAMADLGVKVTVISPIPYFDKAHKNTPEFSEETTARGNVLHVIRPHFLYFGQRMLGPMHISRISLHFFYSACLRAIAKYQVRPEAFYGHFICLAGICACRLGRYYHKPSFIAYGESTDWSIRNYGLSEVKKELATVAGIVAVSSKNREVLLNKGIVTEDKVDVFVNGVNVDKFYPRDREKCRAEYGLKDSDFVVSYVGQFIERKGIRQLCEALDSITNRNESVKAILAGKGEYIPEGNFIRFCGLVEPDKMPEFLSASDVFVFPTQNEGCSNAILEAMACGLPIVSSDAPFNYDILDSENSVLVDPLNVKEIEAAILRLKQDRKLCKTLGKNSLDRVKNLTIEKRAERILKYMEDRRE